MASTERIEEKMTAVIRTSYGGPDALTLVEWNVPKPKAEEVLIQVRATSVNGSDWEGLTGKPFYARIGGVLKPKQPILGSDMSGVVVAVGSGVKKFQLGDEVVGNAMFKLGGFAEYACIAESDTIIKPNGITFAQAATLPQAASVALQAVRDKGKIGSGKKILINGAGGTVGSFAIQIAKTMQTDITAVDCASKMKFLLELGASQFVDYQKEDFVELDQKFDFILDVVGNRSISDLKKALAPDGVYSVAGGRILPALFLGAMASLFSKKHMGVFVWKPNSADLSHVVQMCVNGSLSPIIDRCYGLSETAEAIAAVGEKRTQGIGVVVIE